MGFTLRAVLDTLPQTAQIVVAELNPVVLGWCRGPLAQLTENAVADPRVTVVISDVAELIAISAVSATTAHYDAIVLDLYRGPHSKTDQRDDPLYGSRAIATAKAALKPGGALAVWGENYDEGFAKRLHQAGFTVTTKRPGRSGLRHVVFLAHTGLSQPASSPARSGENFGGKQFISHALGFRPRSRRPDGQ